MSSDSSAASGIGLPRGRELDLPGLPDEARDVLRREPDADGDPGAAGNEGEAGEASVLWRSVNLHFPDLTDCPAAQRAEKLQDHILATAVMRGELARLRLEAHVALRDKRREWDHLLHGVTGKSKAELERRARQQNPKLYDAIEDAKWTIARATEEMDRHGGTEYESASRAYTLLSGG